MCAQTQEQQTEYPKGQAESARALQLRKQQLIAKKQNQAQEMADTPASQIGTKFTAQALKFSWLNLIDSFGLTLIYINFHFLGKYIAGSNLFSDFGEEWLPQGANQAVSGSAAAGAPKWFEIIALFLLDIILAILVLFALIILITPALIVIGLLS